MTDNNEHAERQPEPPAVATRAVLFAALAFVIFVGMSIAGARVYYVWEVREPLNAPPKVFPAPRLQINDIAELARVEEQQRAQLNGYAWIDRDRGVIQIPIDRAIAMIAAKGADGYGPIDAVAPAENPGGSSTP